MRIMLLLLEICPVVKQQEVRCTNKKIAGRTLKNPKRVTSITIRKFKQFFIF